MKTSRTETATAAYRILRDTFTAGDAESAEPMSAEGYRRAIKLVTDMNLPRDIEIGFIAFLNNSEGK